MCLSQWGVVACAATAETEPEKAPVYYSDCSMVHLRNTDASNMTREERIAAEEAALFDALDENRECNQKALTSSQQAVTAAASSQGSGAGDASASHQQGTNNATQSNDNTQQNEQVISSNSGQGGAATGVNGAEITVCQISQENLAAATTPEDKTFWQQEVAKNCGKN